MAVYMVRIEIDEENGQNINKLEQEIWESDLAVDFDILEKYED